MAKEKISLKKKVKGKPKKKISSSAKGGAYQPKIVVIGIGGGGGSIVGEIAKSIGKKGIPHSNRVNFIIANVDYQAIKIAPKKAGVFYFGQKMTHGLGCGMNVALGEESALREKKRITRLLKKYDLCILITCLGGGTGSGATPIFAEISKNLGILTLGICTLPFAFEGKERAKIAKTSLDKTKEKLNSFIIIPNQKIFRIIDQKTPIHKSLSAMNNMLVQGIEGLIETLYSPGLINLDFSDFKTILNQESALAYLNSQEFSGSDRAEKTVEMTLNNPLINYNIAGAKRILFNIAGNKDMKMSEVESISRAISNFNPQAKIIFGVSHDNHYKNKIKITLLAVGCTTNEERKAKIIRQEKIKQQKEEEKQQEERDRIRAEKIKKKLQEEQRLEFLREKQVALEEKQIQNEKKKAKLKLDKKIEEESEKKEKKKIITKKASPKKTQKIIKKTTVRRNALDLHKKVQEDEQKMLEEESKWDVPAFLRGNNNS